MSQDISGINSNKYSKAGAFNYLNDRWHQVRTNKALEIISKFKANSSERLKALDLGCGDGSTAERIKDLGFETHGFDIAEAALANASEKGIVTRIGDLHDFLPYEDGFFDVVFAGEIIEHIADPRKFVVEVNRILKDGGLFVITTPNLAGFDNRVKMLFGKIPRCIEPLSSHHYQHVRPFTFSSLEEFLGRGGFTIDSIKTNRIKLGFTDSYFLADYFPTIGSSIIVGARKNSSVSEIKLNKK